MPGQIASPRNPAEASFKLGNPFLRMHNLPMHNRKFTRRLAPAAGGLFVLSVLAFAIPAGAEEDEPSIEQRIIRGILGGNSDPDIDYRERSPLVIPPSRDLPAPESAASVERARAWPKDPDAARRKEGSTRSKPAIDSYREQGRNLTPEELRRGAGGGRAGAAAPANTQSDNQMARALRPSELGDNKSLFGMMGIGASQPEVVPREPTRSRLTEPPTGYRAPSPSQPYAAPKESGSWFKSLNIFDRGTAEPR